MKFSIKDQITFAEEILNEKLQFLRSDCVEGIERSCHYLLHCPIYFNERLTLLNVIKGIDTSILERNDSETTKVLLYGKSSLNKTSNTYILKATMNFLLEAKQFEQNLF